MKSVSTIIVLTLMIGAVSFAGNLSDAHAASISCDGVQIRLEKL